MIASNDGNCTTQVERIFVFLKLLGKYQEERAGLYNTPSYDPYKLQSVINAEERRGGAVFDITDSHKDALNLQTELNHDMAQVVL